MFKISVFIIMTLQILRADILEDMGTDEDFAQGSKLPINLNLFNNALTLKPFQSTTCMLL